MAINLVRADRFTIKELTDAYNQTRVDYIVPMPMSVARLLDYITLYDVNLGSSWVAVDQERFLGLGMLGVRPNRAWITRLGVLPDGRRRGIGRAILERLLASAEELEATRVWLEVISGNGPAYRLFTSSGFEETRELLVARRPPELLPTGAAEQPLRDNDLEVQTFNRDGSETLLSLRSDAANWLNEAESLLHIEDLMALSVRFPNGGFGWVCYRIYMFQLANILVHVVRGDLHQVATAVLKALHRRHPTLDAVLENIATSDPIWRAFEQEGYFDTFRRIEMVKRLDG